MFVATFNTLLKIFKLLKQQSLYKHLLVIIYQKVENNKPFRQIIFLRIVTSYRLFFWMRYSGSVKKLCCSRRAFIVDIFSIEQ